VSGRSYFCISTKEYLFGIFEAVLLETKPDTHTNTEAYNRVERVTIDILDV
jgi:hypothetical protein